jgi:hypothetical protein
MFVRWRPGSIFLLVLQAFWLNVVLPGHQRGLIVLGPETGAAAAASDCHTKPTKCCHKEESSKPSPCDEQSRKSRCAVCAFAARLTVPPAPIVAPTLLELRHEAPTLALQRLFSPDLIPAYFERGPPVA